MNFERITIPENRPFEFTPIPTEEFEDAIRTSHLLRHAILTDQEARNSLPAIPNSKARDAERDLLIREIATRNPGMSGIEASRMATRSIGEKYGSAHAALRLASGNALNRLYSTLRTEKEWKHVFRTGYATPDAERDSIYLVTPAGMSLRLKVSLLADEGLAGVVQPFAERIFFTSSEEAPFLPQHRYLASHLSDRPTLGSAVHEYGTQAFRNAQEHVSKGDQPGIQSPAPSNISAKEEGGVISISCPSPTWSHPGHAVNWIE